MEDNFSMDRGGRNGFGVNQANHIYSVLYFYYISSISHHQANIRSHRLGTPALEIYEIFNSILCNKPVILNHPNSITKLQVTITHSGIIKKFLNQVVIAAKTDPQSG